MGGCLTLPAHLQGVPADPRGASGSSGGLAETSALAQAARGLAGRCETAQFSVLVYCLHDPVDLGITTDGLEIDYHPVENDSNRA